MMKSEVKIFDRGNGEIQRVQVVRFADWAALDFLQPEAEADALDCFWDIYRKFLVPACPWIFGQMALFRVPKGGEKSLTEVTKELQNGVRLKQGKPMFQNEKAKALWEQLEAKDCIRVVGGKLPFTKMIPVRDCAGYLSKQEPGAVLRVNSSFFIMDPIDCATMYDQVGTPFGLCVKDGVVLSPPLYQREALLVYRDGRVEVDEPDLWTMEIEINGNTYAFGDNADLYMRPHWAKTPKSENSQKIVIVGDRVVDVKEQGRVAVPASGFVLCPFKACEVKLGDRVCYHGLEEVLFGIQVGNSVMRDGVKTETFRSRFYNIRRLQRVPYPPSLYPMDFEKGRAARIVLGADAEGKPMLLWAEGAGKLNYVPGEDSTGASLSEMAQIAEAVGMVNGVHLDGGGSAQILLHGERALHISDRKAEDNSDAERMVPLGLIVR
ncbi:MAG: phosphodiester glycosidase family protein [Lachnospiraceae bacterium]|nr:phosphodiester glycosidase family protein [Lachnospiraceae bacterium]